MDAIQILRTEIAKVLSGNTTYETYQERWEYLLTSYVGGDEYRRALNLTRYQLESEQEYNARLRSTPLDNQCQSVVSVYNSFLFQNSPEREFMSIAGMPEVDDFLWDADLEGRTLDSFMKDVATWSSVFGHCWIMVAKPNIGAGTLADEQAAQVRPYVSLLTPLVVLDWEYSRDTIGRYVLTYFKYIEEVNGDTRTVKEWYQDRIRTVTVNVSNDTVSEETIEDNQLGKIPAVIAYNGRSIIRGIGVSDITDIADCQRQIYNMLSELEQSIRLDSHPSLVKTPETEAGIGAGSIIHMPENLDPGLRPFVLEFSGASVDSILNSINHLVATIEKMANIGSIRSTESRRMSGVAQEQEFQLLNARLSDKAKNLELAEEQLWTLWCEYMGQTWNGYTKYPSSFNLRDAQSEIAQLKMAKDTATDPIVARKIDEQILEWMGCDKTDLEYQDINPITGRTYPDGEPIPESLPPLYIPETDLAVPTGQNCANCEYYKGTESYCMKFDANVRPVYWCAKWERDE